MRFRLNSERAGKGSSSSAPAPAAAILTPHLDWSGFNLSSAPAPACSSLIGCNFAAPSNSPATLIKCILSGLPYCISCQNYQKFQYMQSRLDPTKFTSGPCAWPVLHRVVVWKIYIKRSDHSVSSFNQPCHETVTMVLNRSTKNDRVMKLY